MVVYFLKNQKHYNQANLMIKKWSFNYRYWWENQLDQDQKLLMKKKNGKNKKLLKN